MIAGRDRELDQGKASGGGVEFQADLIMTLTGRVSSVVIWCPRGTQYPLGEWMFKIISAETGGGGMGWDET